MPTYSFECPGCGKEEDRVMMIGQYTQGEHRCSRCGATLERVFKPGHEVIEDSFKKPIRFASLDGAPMVSSKSELRRAMDRHDAKHGTKLERL